MSIILLLITYLTGVSANSYGLSGLFNEASGSADAIFSNPAVLPPSKFAIVFGMRQNFFMSELTDFHFGVSTGTKRFGIGLGVTKMGIKDVVADYRLLAGIKFAVRGFKVGLNSRIGYLRSLEAGEDSLRRITYSMDLGLAWRIRMFNFYMSYLNFLRPSEGLLTSTEKSESELLLGTAFSIPEPVTWFLGVDIWRKKVSYRVASEMWFTKGFGIRFGILERELRLGLCLRTEDYGVDLSFGSSRELGTTYVITTHYSLK